MNLLILNIDVVAAALSFSQANRRFTYEFDLRTISIVFLLRMVFCLHRKNRAKADRYAEQEMTRNS